MKRLLTILALLLVFATIGYVIFKYTKLFKSKNILAVDRSKIRVEIINCSGVNGEGTHAQDVLRSLGFDVFEVRSGTRTIDKTTAIEHTDPDLSNANEISIAMSYIKKSKPLPIFRKVVAPEIQKDIDSLLYLDVTVVLGKDCSKYLLKPKIKI
jgi:hypothetical protein